MGFCSINILRMNSLWLQFKIILFQQQMILNGCVFPMVIWPAFRMGQYRVNDHLYHAPSESFDIKSIENLNDSLLVVDLFLVLHNAGSIPWDVTFGFSLLEDLSCWGRESQTFYGNKDNPGYVWRVLLTLPYDWYYFLRPTFDHNRTARPETLLKLHLQNSASIFVFQIAAHPHPPYGILLIPNQIYIL